MEVANLTPFPAITWENADANKQWHITTVVRVKYVFRQTARKGEWKLRLTPEQGELVGGDEFYDNDIEKPVRYESDLVTFKPNTDIVFNAKARTSTPKKKWHCGVTIKDGNQKILRSLQLSVRGPTTYTKKGLTGWTEGWVEKTDQVAIRYDKAKGGKVNNPEADQEDEPLYLTYDDYNPVGTGKTHRKMQIKEFPAEQVEWHKLSHESNKYPPGFGFTHRSWKPRISYAGTYDDEWLENQHPYPPHDFDYYHNQAANPELIMDGYIQAGTAIEMENLLTPDSIDRFKIPELYCFAESVSKPDKMKRNLMNIDTVLIDIEDDDPASWAVYLSYRDFQPKQTPIEELRMKYLPKEILEEQNGG